MALPTPPSNTTPIPNNPFYSPETTYFCGPYYPALVTGSSGICVNQYGVVIVTGGGGGGGGVTALSPGLGIALSGSTGSVTVATNLVAGTNIALTPSGNQITISATGLGVGTVTSVTAGSGLTGGTIINSGTIALNNACIIPPTAFNLKGNILVGTASGAYTALNPGTNGQVLMACSTAGAAGLCWSAVGSVTSVNGNAPISVANTTTTPLISIASASTTGAGAVQLYNNTNSTSTTLALTAAQGKNLQDQINGIILNGNIELAGTIDASSGLVLSVTSVGSADGYTVGSTLPAATLTTKNTYVIVTTPGTLTPPGGSPTVATRGDWFLVSELTPGVYSWVFLDVGFNAPAATDTVPGIVELATNAETVAGTSATLATTPLGVATTYIAKSALTAKGDLISATAASTPLSVGVGTDGQVLTACSIAPTGLCWTTPVSSGIPCACITAKGSLVTGTGVATPTAFPVGGDGSILVACSTTLTGLCWAPAPAPAIPCACILAKGDIIAGTGLATPLALGVGTDNQVLVACSVNPTGLCWTTANIFPATPTVTGTVLGCTTASNSALGCNALLVNTGISNVAVGVNALCSNLTGSQNVAIGAGALAAATSNSNLAAGNNALTSLTTGFANTALGSGALRANVAGNYSAAVGFDALCSATGSTNTALGALAGKNITSGVQNVIIGPNVDAPVPTSSCQLAIGFDATCYWLTGCSDCSIRPGAGIRDCANNLGTANQVLSSTGSVVEWATPTYSASCVFAVCITSGGGATYPPNGFIGNWVPLSGIGALGNYAAIQTMHGYGNSVICLPVGVYAVDFNLTGEASLLTPQGQSYSFTMLNAVNFAKAYGVASLRCTPPPAGGFSGNTTIALNSTGVIQVGAGSCAFTWRYTYSGAGSYNFCTFPDLALWKFTKLT